MKNLYPLAILISIILSTIVLIDNFGPTSRAGVAETLGINGGGYTIPFGDQVGDFEYGGKEFSFQECTNDGAEDQKIYASIEGKYLGVFYMTPAPANSYCWQTTKKTDPAMLAKVAQWLDYNARNAGYGILQYP